MNYEEYLKKILNKNEIELMHQEYNKKAVTCFRFNKLKCDQENKLTLFDGLDKHSYVDEAFYFDKEILKLGKNPLHNAGAYYIQDASAMMVVKLLGINKGDKVLDLCAAPGGKSTQIASYLNQSGILVSNDISSKRVKDLSENIERIGASNVIVMNEDVEKISRKFQGFFDKVILDAPCSGQGMFRKNVLTYEDWSYEKTLRLVEVQKDLILNAYKCLKKDGIMVYSTCTFAVEENEEIIKYLLDNSNASIISINLEDDFSASIGIDGAIRLYPFKFKGEGHFICLIKSNDSYENNINYFNKLAYRKDIELYRQFEKEYLNVRLEGDFIRMGDELHLLMEDCFNLDGLKVLRNGLHLGSLKNNRFEPNHALAMYLKKENVKNSVDFGYNDKRVTDYLKGFTLDSINKKGYVLMCVNGISLGWCKDDGRYLKNLYPKGLRNLD